MRNSLVSAALLLVPFAHAQADGQSAGLPQTTVIYPEIIRPQAATIDAPQPPGGFVTSPRLAFTPVPPGQGGLPLPDSPPSTPQPPPDPVTAGTGAFTFFYNLPVSPGPTSQICEPTCAIARDTAIYTGNFTCGISGDSGRTWTSVNPFTRFPALDGGFCCDQRTVYVSNGATPMTIWLLEYRFSATTNAGSLRIARAQGRDGLRNDSWVSYQLSPLIFNQPGRFLDYSDIAFGTTHLYGSCIIGDPSNNTAAGLLLWRAPLQQIYDAQPINISYYTTAQLGGFGSYRFAQGSTSTMFWAAHTSTTNLRVYSWGEAAPNATIFNRAVSAWSGTATPAPGPDGRDWTGFAYTVNTVLSGHATPSEVGFWWTSGAVSGRPQTFVRVARFNPAGLGAIGQFDLWNPAFAYHFPAVSTNSLNHIGGVFAYGGGTIFPSTAAFLLDQYNSFASWASFAARNGTAGPLSNRWGDYSQCVRNSNLTQTFSAAGFTMQGASVEPRYLWFGRNDYEPTYVNLNVQSTPVTAIPITIAETDRFGAKNGSTNFVRTFPPNQGYEVTAPLTHVSGGTTYRFCYWSWQFQPGGSFVDQPEGQRTFTASSIESLDDTVIARYLAQRTLQVRSINPASGVPITVSLADLNGLQNGSTAFDRLYKNGDVVTLTAPANMGTTRPFRRWILDGVNQPLGQQALAVTLNNTRTATADFANYSPGTFVTYGTGCPGTGGNIPRHSGTGVPEIGRTVNFETRHVVANTLGVLYFGVRQPPINLAFLGMGATCTLDLGIIINVSIVLNAAGFNSIPWTIANNTALIGQRNATQVTLVDLGATSPLKLVQSNALETTIGGVQ
jgi:hypothetical protein